MTSTFIRAISTPVGHSRLHPLQDTHNFIVSAMSSLAIASGPNWPDRASRSVLARPRVLSFSSPVTRNDGHITPPSSLRQAPLLLHISTAPCIPPAAPGQADQSSCVGNSSTEYPGAKRNSSRASIFGASIILPGLNKPCGSNKVLTLRNSSTIFGPNITSLNSDRTIPSPCSPEWDPPY